MLVGRRVRAHRPELEGRERPLVEPEPRLPEQHRARRVELDPDGDRREERRQEHEQGGRAHDVEGALQEQGVAAHPGRRQAHELHRLDRRHAGARSERLEQPGHDVHLHAQRLQLPYEPQHLAFGRTREPEHDAVDRELLDERRQLAPRRASTGTSATSSRSRAGEASTKPTSEIPYSGCWSELAGHELRVPVGADDQRPLDEVAAAPDDHARSRSRDRDQHDRERPEDDPLPEVGVGGTGDVRDDEAEPHDRRHEGDDADEVVDGRVLRPLGVAVVEPHRPSQDDPQRKAGGEEEGLAVERQPIVRRPERET